MLRLSSLALTVYVFLAALDTNSAFAELQGAVPSTGGKPAAGIIESLKGNAGGIEWTSLDVNGWSDPEVDQVADLLLDMASNSMSEGDLPGAIDHAERALELGRISDSKVIASLRTKGIANLYLGNFDQSIANFSSALSLNPTDVFMLWQRCWAATELRFFPSAQRDCARARAIVDRNARMQSKREFSGAYDDFYVSLAEANLASAETDYQTAINSLQRAHEAIQRLPTDDVSKSILAINIDTEASRALRALGRFDEALAKVQSAIDLSNLDSKGPNKDQANDALHEKALVLAQSGETSSALALLLSGAANNASSEQYLLDTCILGLNDRYAQRVLSACDGLLKLSPENQAYQKLMTKVEALGGAQKAGFLDPPPPN